MKFSQGIVSTSLVIGLVIMAIVLPLVGGLALKNQDNRNRATGCPRCYSGYHCNSRTDYECVPDKKAPTSKPRPTSKPSKKCSGVSNSVECAYIPGCNWSGGKCSGNYPTTTTRCTSNSGCTGGQICSSGGKCVSRTTPTRTITPLLPTLTPAPVYGCMLYDVCPTGHYCFANKCIKNKPIGQGCLFDKECQTKKCDFVGLTKKCVADYTGTCYPTHSPGYTGECNPKKPKATSTSKPRATNTPRPWY